MAELGPMGQALMSGVRAMKEKKKQDEEAQGLLGTGPSQVSYTCRYERARQINNLPMFFSSFTDRLSWKCGWTEFMLYVGFSLFSCRRSCD